MTWVRIITSPTSFINLYEWHPDIIRIQTDHKYEEIDYKQPINGAYYFSLNAQSLMQVNSSNAFGTTYGCRCKANDIVHINLNLIENTIYFGVNDIDYGKAFDIIDGGEYRVGLTVYGPGTGFTLIKYTANKTKAKISGNKTNNNHSSLWQRISQKFK